MRVKKKIEQILVKNNGLIESSELSIILLKHDSKQEKRNLENIKKQYELFELYETLNPKYSENIISLKEAKLKVEISDIIYSSKYNIFRHY